MTINLEHNKIPYGLLSKEEQEHLFTWTHGLECWVSYTDTWYRTSLKGFSLNTIDASNIYRTIPAPVEPERAMGWLVLPEFGGISVEPYRLEAKEAIMAHGGFALRIEFDATTGDNPTITKETFDE